MVEVAKEIGKHLHALRKEQGLTLQAVADRAGLSKAHVWEIERCRRTNPTVRTTMALASALGVSIEYMIGSVSSEDPGPHQIKAREAAVWDAATKAAAGACLDWFLFSSSGECDAAVVDVIRTLPNPHKDGGHE